MKDITIDDSTYNKLQEVSGKLQISISDMLHDFVIDQLEDFYELELDEARRYEEGHEEREKIFWQQAGREF